MSVLNNLPTHPATGLVSSKALLAHAHAMRRNLAMETAQHWMMWKTACTYVRLATQLREREIIASRRQRLKDYYQ